MQKFLHLMDVVKVGLAGNLRDFLFQDHRGNKISGKQLLFRGQPTGVAANPLETVNYVSAHDGFTLWDAIQAKLPFRTPFQGPGTDPISERVLRHQLALSFPLMAQGMIFIEGGSELLRSKNGDVDSYDSGDFFNALDLTGHQNGWGKALPPDWKNGQAWDFWYPRLIAPDLRVGQREITQTLSVVRELARFRQQSPFFKMRTLAEVQNQLRFFGSTETPVGIIPMLIQTQDRELLVVWNVTRLSHTWKHEALNPNSIGQAWSATFPYEQGILTRLIVQFSEGEKSHVSLPPLSLSIWTRRK
jgi:pullulanase